MGLLFLAGLILSLWWLHALASFGFIALIPFTPLLHFVTGPLNLLLAQPALGRLEPLSLEQVEASGVVGVGKIDEFTRQQFVSLDACMECGRCEEDCPATTAGKPLSPRVVVQDLRGLMNALLKSEGPALHGQTVSAETLWACTSCSACTAVCPVRVDALGLIFDLRRNLTAEGVLTATAANSLRSMQANGNPWGFAPTDRLAWAEGLAVPTCRQNPEFDILWWIGCAGS